MGEKPFTHTRARTHTQTYLHEEFFQALIRLCLAPSLLHLPQPFFFNTSAHPVLCLPTFFLSYRRFQIVNISIHNSYSVFAMSPLLSHLSMSTLLTASFMPVLLFIFSSNILFFNDWLRC